LADLPEHFDPASSQIFRDRGELLQGRFQIRRDVGGDDFGGGQVGGFFQRFVLQPEDVEIHLVALGQYIEHAARRNAGAALAFEVGDATRLACPDRQFDRVLSLLVLHFVPDPARAIAEMCRVARQGAVVAAAVWDARGGFVANRLFFDTAAALDPRAAERRARNYTRPMTRPGELAAAWRMAGLRDVTETALCIRMEFADFDDYWAPCLGRDGPQADYVATLDEVGRARLRDAVRSAYLDGEPDGPRSYAALAWAVKGIAAG
jgi:SAM-dependent methyltransferase